MNVQIVGTMLDPSGGEPAGGAMIQFIALAQYGGVPKGAQSTQTTSATGEYDFPLNYGRYTLAINHSGRFVNQAVSVTVNEDSPSVMDIDLLLESSVPLTPPEIKYVEELVDQAEQAALSSSNSASQAGVEVINATNQANIATNEADRAKSEADRATEVTGLDTVEQAVDMALGEFAGIMTESEARALQAQNQGYYAASGMVHTGKQYPDGGSFKSVNEGMWTRATTPSVLQIGRAASQSGVGTSKTDFGVMHIAGAVANLTGKVDTTDLSALQFQLPQAEDGTRTYNKATGDSITHPDAGTAFALAASSDDIEVVTHPVDLVGLEYYEEELTGRQEVFECIQSLGTTFGTTSVPTVLSTRKLSYFQQYDGQFPEVTANPDFINDRYRCVVWTDLTEPQKREVAAYIGEKLFMGVNGFPVNGRLRARTIRGAGNGDWHNINSATGLSSAPDGALTFGYELFAQVQGANDTVGTLSVGSSDYYLNADNPSIALPDQATIKGCFVQRRNAEAHAYQGRCFMYVVATVPRANKGAYHPDLNEYGTAQLAYDTGGSGTVNSGTAWHSSAIKEELKPKTLKDCFGDWLRFGQAINKPSRFVEFTTTFYNTGSIASGKSGHPDGIFYDGIEAGGLNGIIDWRLPAVANESPEEAAKVEAKVENGTYRGLEKLVRTKVYATGNGLSTQAGSAGGSIGNTWVLKTTANYVDNPDLDFATPNDVYPMKDSYITASDGSVQKIDSVYSSNGVTTWTVAQSRYPINPFITWVSKTGIHGTYCKETNLSVSGEFSTQMVVGDPANILLTDALKDGWLGTWCPVIPTGAEGEIPLLRKNLDSSGFDYVRTVDNGVSWSASKVSGASFDSSKNAFIGNLPATEYIGIWSYKAFAKQTKPSTNKPVYNAKAGLMGVFVSSAANVSYGATLGESLIGKVLKSTGAGSSTVLTIDELRISPETGGLNVNAINATTHKAISTLTNLNNSPAVKVLSYQISNNGQGSIGYQANELTHEAITVLPLQAGVNLTMANGVFYRLSGFDNQSFNGRLLLRVGSESTVTLAANYFDGMHIINDTVTDIASDTASAGWALATNGWGDDSAIKVTADGSDTFVDLNGNTNLSVVHELAIPYTWTSNHARAGEQVDGVDL